MFIDSWIAKFSRLDLRLVSTQDSFSTERNGQDSLLGNQSEGNVIG